MTKYPPAAGADPEDLGRALVSDSESILDESRMEAQRRLLKALRFKVPEDTS